MADAPVRVCCGQRHAGPVCPDGKVMCCLCFGRFPPYMLAVDIETGIAEDVCQTCSAAEFNAQWGQAQPRESS